jgi:hypothetical protein
MCCLPGTRARAISPTTNPVTIQLSSDNMMDSPRMFLAVPPAAQVRSATRVPSSAEPLVRVREAVYTARVPSGAAGRSFGCRWPGTRSLGFS